MNRSTGVLTQAWSATSGGVDGGQRLKAPVTGTGLQVERTGRSGRRGGFGDFAPPGRAFADPFDQNRDLVGGQLRLGRHLIRFAVADGIDQQALVGLARHDGRRGVAPRQHCLARVEPQVALVLFRPVTALAAGNQQRPHLLLEELDGGRIIGGGRGRRLGPRGAVGQCCGQANPNCAAARCEQWRHDDFRRGRRADRRGRPERKVFTCKRFGWQLEYSRGPPVGQRRGSNAPTNTGSAALRRRRGGGWGCCGCRRRPG